MANPKQPNTNTNGGQVYQAIMTQTGTNNPATIIINDTINITWTRNGVGDYTGTTSGSFPIGKTFAPPFGDGTSAIILPLSYDTTGYYQISPQGNTNTIKLFTFADTALTPKELSDIGGSLYINIFTIN